MLIQASQFLDPRGSFVDSAQRLANHVVDLLKQKKEERVEISFAGLRGLPSSYFNVLLQSIIQAGFREMLDDSIKFQLESDAQRLVYGRSRNAVLGHAV
jgi:hypothetical protein